MANVLFGTKLRSTAQSFDNVLQDVRYGSRLLAGSPGFTATALISLSLGICIAFLDPQDKRSSEIAPAVVSYRFWQQHLGGDPVSSAGCCA
ncbi:MAG: hypothetical protein U0Q18_00750 [Bryobacteraceae bacterium]